MVTALAGTPGEPPGASSGRPHARRVTWNGTRHQLCPRGGAALPLGWTCYSLCQPRAGMRCPGISTGTDTSIPHTRLHPTFDHVPAKPGMHKSLEPKAAANRPVGLPTAKHSPPAFAGDLLALRGAQGHPMELPRVQGAAALVPAWGQVTHAHPFPWQSPTVPILPAAHFPRCCSPELQPCSTPRDGALGWGCPQGSRTSSSWEQG